jgi:hypothetical protein
LLVQVGQVVYTPSVMVMDRLVASHQLIVSKHRAMEDLLPLLVAVVEKVELLSLVYQQ